MILTVDPTRALPVYEQVREQISRMVAAGSLSAGTRLPTIRQLAADLGIAKGTVERAYELLEADAVIERRGASGSFVSNVKRAPDHELIASLESAAEALVVVARQLGATRPAVLRAVQNVWGRF